MPTDELTVSQVIEAWNSISDRWIVRRNKEHDTRQIEVVHDWGGDVISEDTMKLVGRCHTYEEGELMAKAFEENARGGAVMKLFNDHW